MNDLKDLARKNQYVQMAGYEDIRGWVNKRDPRYYLAEPNDIRGFQGPVWHIDQVFVVFKIIGEEHPEIEEARATKDAVEVILGSDFIINDDGTITKKQPVSQP